MAVATEQLSFKKLFCDPNPYFDPYSANLEESDVDHTTEDTEKMQLDPETGLPMRPAVQPLFPHVEPPMSASARESAKCFNFDEFNASTPAGQYPYEWNPDWRLLRDFLAKEGRLSIEAALELVKRTRNILQRESNVLRLRPPYTLVGDVHGQYYDLLSMFEKVGDPDTVPYLFLGDYVDRGMFGCEIVFLLCALKLNYPNTFYLIRGNHECRFLTAHFTFLRETLKKYRSQRLYDEVMLLFDALPLAVLLEDEESRFLCVHGGLSPDVPSIADIENIDRFQEPGKTGALCDLLWSDPLEEDTADGLSSSDMQEWYEVKFVENSTRGCGWVFGYAAAKEFLETNELTAIIRAHEVQRAGYGLNNFKQPTHAPFVITVFSAPNYCDFYANKAAVMKISPPRYDTGDEMDQHTRLEFVQFDCVPHPFWLPKLQNGIEYTMPFLAEKLKQIMNYFISTKGLGKETPEESAFYQEIEDMLRQREAAAQSSTASSDSKPPSVRLPRTPSGRLLVSKPPPEKQFLTVKDRIDMLQKDSAARGELAKRLSSIRGGMIEGKILQSRIAAYLSKATSKFQKAKQQDWVNEGRPMEDEDAR